MHNLHESIIVAVIYLNTYNYRVLHFKSLLNYERNLIGRFLRSLIFLVVTPTHSSAATGRPSKDLTQQQDDTLIRVQAQMRRLAQARETYAFSGIF
jgi:hypothetical protein